jgi:hypothetical protein
MSESAFHHLEHEWQGGGRHAAGWFRRHAHHDGSPASDGDTITVNPPDPSQPGDTVSLATLAASMKTDLEELLVRGHNLADQLMPQVAAIGEEAENDELIQAVEAAVLPPEARTLIAELITKLAKTYPQPAPAEAA